MPFFSDHRALLAAVPLDVLVICTPPRTHLPIALDALAAGCDILLEKPPLTSVEEHEKLTAALASAGKRCQVGFQALGSHALRRLATADLGTVTGLATVASWRRDDAYYTRAPWAGRQGSGDGALVNPLAHALMQSLAIADDAPITLTAERYRTRPIETDDTAFARITFRNGQTLMAAVTLAGEDFIAGEVIVTGDKGHAVLEYPTDRLRINGEEHTFGRTDLLTNLLDGTPLLAPLSRTKPFTQLASALTAGPTPTLLDTPYVTDEGDGPQRVRVIKGINDVLRQVAETALLPSELGIDWARPESAVQIALA